MWLLAVIALTYGTALWLLATISDSWLVRIALALVYVVAGEYAHRVGALRWTGARSSALAHLVQSLAPVHFDGRSSERLVDLACSRRQVVFGIAPHGPLCLGLVVGFAGHCGQVPRVLSQRLVIVGHWLIRALPFVRELASAFDIVSCARVTVDEALDRGQHLALIPCGMRSKMRCLTDAARDHRTIVVHRSATALGFLALAARYGTLVVPVLAPDEPRLYELWGTGLGLWPLTLVIGRYLLLPLRESTLRVGASIDTLKYAADIRGLERAYYDALEELAAPTHRIEYEYV